MIDTPDRGATRLAKELASCQPPITVQTLGTPSQFPSPSVGGKCRRLKVKHRIYVKEKRKIRDDVFRSDYNVYIYPQSRIELLFCLYLIFAVLH